MAPPLPLQGVRIQLSGSIPDGSAQSGEIESFVTKFAAALFREGGTLIHGNHPSLQDALRRAAGPYVAADGAKDALTLVRTQKYARTPEQLAEIEAFREYAAVQVIPEVSGKSLVSMREWMAERCDAIVAIGGRHYEINKALAGVPDELEEALRRGKPAFAIAGFGGAVAGYVRDHDEIFSRLRNGLSPADNRLLAKDTDVEQLVQRIIDQLKLLPLVRESISQGRPFRILALDGGGLRGAFTAAVLAQWDDMLKGSGSGELVKHFDLVAGTSTGAILAIGLGLGLTPREILDFYQREGPNIFPQDGNIRHWLWSKHEATTLRSILASVLTDKKLSEHSCCRLVIPTVRAIHGEAEVIVTAHSPDRTGFAGISAVDAALASSAAPTYFDEASFAGAVANEKYLDGGVWANNPALPAIAEAVRHLKIPLGRIDVLSVGTLGSEADFTSSLGKGKLGWASTSVDLFFAAQENGAARLADDLLSPARHLRINQQTPIAIKLDDAGAIEQMTLRGSDVGKDSFVAVRSRFLDGFHAPDWRQKQP